jgi:two-component system, NtrC family, response regulator GlrR
LNATNKSLLIVDDEPDLLFILSVRLKGKGYEVDVTTKPQEAIELISKKDYSAIFCDLTMPGTVNCFDILNCVRNKGQKDNFYFMTGYTNGASMMEKAMREVEQHYILTKPLDFKKILDILSGQIKKPQSS